MPTLAIVLSTAEDRGDWARAEKLVLAAREQGHEVSLFLMTDAAPYASSAGVGTLLDAGCDVYVCATSFGDGVAAPGVVVGSQDDHAALVHRADRVLSLT